MEKAVVGLLVLALCSGIAIVRSVARSPRCRTCGNTGEARPIQHTGAPIPVIETVYWCPRCAEVISRRLVTPLWEW